MKSLKKILPLIIVAIATSMMVINCKVDEKEGSGCKRIDDTIATAKPLNISVYLDLSDRLQRELTPAQFERDTAIICHLVDKFITDCQTNGKIINSKNHFQIFFYPAPNSSEIAVLAKGLNVDLSKTQIAEKKVELNAMKERFTSNLQKIYEGAIKDQQFVGSDIWGFFSNKTVDNLCIRPGYRNILVILTDGYLYHAANKTSEGNAYSYITQQTVQNPNSSLLVKRDGLEDLEVLMLEVNPLQPSQREKMISVLEEWFRSMGVKHFVVSDTDMPVNTEAYIDNFIEQ